MLVGDRFGDGCSSSAADTASSRRSRLEVMLPRLPPRSAARASSASVLGAARARR